MSKLSTFVGFKTPKFSFVFDFVTPPYPRDIAWKPMTSGDILVQEISRIEDRVSKGNFTIIPYNSPIMLITMNVVDLVNSHGHEHGNGLIILKNFSFLSCN